MNLTLRPSTLHSAGSLVSVLGPRGPGKCNPETQDGRRHIVALRHNLKPPPSGGGFCVSADNAPLACRK